MTSEQTEGRVTHPAPQQAAATTPRTRGKDTPVGGQDVNVASDADIRELGFDVTPRGWRPRTSELEQALQEVDDRRTDRTRSFVPEPPFRIPGNAECVVCGENAEASTCGTPSCSWICTAVLMEQLLPKIADWLYTRADGSGGRDSVRPITPPRSRKRLSVVPTGSFSVETALERLVDCRTVLERHGVDVRWGRMARCPFHDDEHPSMSLYERRGRSRAHCFPCDWDGDAVDLEAALAGEDLKTTIRRWS